MTSEDKFSFEKNITRVELPRTSTGTATVDYDYKGVRGTLMIQLDGFDMQGWTNQRRVQPADGNYRTPATDFVGPCHLAVATEEFNMGFHELVKNEFPQDRETALRNGEIFRAQMDGERMYGIL